MRLEKKAVIFDLDGVICATDRLQFQAWQAVAGPLGITLDEAVTDRLRGVSTEACLDIVLEGRSFDREEREALMEKKRAAYRELLRTLGPADLRDEVGDTLWELRARGYRLALGSSSGEAGFILERIGLGDFFDAVVSGADLTRAKPDPEVFLTAAGRLGVLPEDCAVVEDARAGIQAARAGGMTALALFGSARGCGLEDYNLTSFHNLLQILP